MAQVSKARKTYSAPALEKGLDVLELLSRSEVPLSATQIAQQLGRSSGEIFRMVVVLEQRGYIKLTDGDRYSLTLRLFDLAMRDNSVRSLTAAATKVMAVIAAETQQSCHLVIYNNGRGSVIANEVPSTDRTFSVGLGTNVPLLDSCSGHVLLAFSDVEKREQMLAQAKLISKPKQSSASIQRIIDKVQKRGYESIKSPQISGVHDISYPIFDHSGDAVAALAIPFLERIGNTQAMDLASCSALLQKAAKEISLELGMRAE